MTPRRRGLATPFPLAFHLPAIERYGVEGRRPQEAAYSHHPGCPSRSQGHVCEGGDKFGQGDDDGDAQGDIADLQAGGGIHGGNLAPSALNCTRHGTLESMDGSFADPSIIGGG